VGRVAWFLGLNRGARWGRLPSGGVCGIGHSLLDIGYSRARGVAAPIYTAGRPHPYPSPGGRGELWHRRPRRCRCAPSRCRCAPSRCRCAPSRGRLGHMATCATAPAFEAHEFRPERSTQPTTSQPFASDRPGADLCNAIRCVSCCSVAEWRHPQRELKRGRS